MPKLSLLLSQLRLVLAANEPALHCCIRCCLAQHISTVLKHNPCNSTGTMFLSKLNLYSEQCFFCEPHSLPSLQQLSNTCSKFVSEFARKICFVKFEKAIKLFMICKYLSLHTVDFISYFYWNRMPGRVLVKGRWILLLKLLREIRFLIVFICTPEK